LYKSVAAKFWAYTRAGSFHLNAQGQVVTATGEALGTVKSWIRGGLLRLRESFGEASS
jgi:flagellar hook protein FlgE